MTTKERFTQYFRPALWLASLGALISLFACTFLIGSGIFEKLAPIGLAVVFTGINLAMARIPAIARHSWLKTAANVVFVILASACLHFI
jgi:hypothetical protein